MRKWYNKHTIQIRKTTTKSILVEENDIKKSKLTISEENKWYNKSTIM